MAALLIKPHPQAESAASVLLALEPLFDTLVFMSFRDNQAAATLQQHRPETWNSPPSLQVVLDAAVGVLAADDERGSRVGAVVQADEVGWDSIGQLLDLALYGRLAHRLREHNGSAGQGCPVCAAADRMWCTALVDPVVQRRGVSTTELHDEMRRLVLVDLG